ncbi:geranylgeranyl pyrophosphate synthetase [Lepidopterella palustris CBS 459.81]|uniref:geranylgeranyl diphosphate synthase n=1 Tax=Lepidopterella palustris CBS 459.81 TaxID=1314670 RepID=A0A8E2E930_9PEZI|nr:geranylgeranyl pyrophosphate synthetase [Lepidopterella palustris CBS 459.81]
MVSEHLKSPNAIPPRTSSHGIVSNGIHASSSKAVLRPLPEIDWIAQGKKHNSNLSHTHPYPVPMSPPPPDPLKSIGNDLINQKHASWTEEKEKILLGPYEYLYGHPGKDIRSQLIAAFNKWLDVPAESLEIITKVVGMLHTASLLVDDVEDSSVLRRGVPVANKIFGTAQVINGANYVYFLALRELSKLSNPKMIDIFTEELLNLHRGQGMDLYWRDSLICPTESDYLEMVGNKTGGLFRLAIGLMQAGSSRNIDCVPLVNTIGILYQILDDHLNLSAYSSAKGLCEDLTEGKFSFPVIHAIRADPSNLVLINILKQKTTDEEVKKYAVSYMEQKGSFEYCKKCIKELRHKAEKLVEELEQTLGPEGKEGGDGMRKILEKLALK